LLPDYLPSGPGTPGFDELALDGERRLVDYRSNFPIASELKGSGSDSRFKAATT